jgi:hypothetical protein
MGPDGESGRTGAVLRRVIIDIPPVSFALVPLRSSVNIQQGAMYFCLLGHHGGHWGPSNLTAIPVIVW